MHWQYSNLFAKFQFVEQLKQGFSPLLLSFPNIKISLYLFSQKFSHNFFIPKRIKARGVRLDLNRFCPCFLKCYHTSAISKCYRKNWRFETPSFLVSKTKKKYRKQVVFGTFYGCGGRTRSDLPNSFM